MTYQIGFRCADGVVLASDRRELLTSPSSDQGSGPATHSLRKIQIASSGRFAWAYAGSKIAPVAARYIQKTFSERIVETDQQIDDLLIESGDASWIAADGPQGQSTILLVDAINRTIKRAKLFPNGCTVVDTILEGYCLAGFSWSVASLLPQVWYSEGMSVDRTIRLAACALTLAERIDPLCVAGADIVAFRNSTQAFEFVPDDQIAREGLELDRNIRDLIQSIRQ